MEKHLQKPTAQVDQRVEQCYPGQGVLRKVERVH